MNQHCGLATTGDDTGCEGLMWSVSAGATGGRTHSGALCQIVNLARTPSIVRWDNGLSPFAARWKST